MHGAPRLTLATRGVRWPQGCLKYKHHRSTQFSPPLATGPPLWHKKNTPVSQQILLDKKRRQCTVQSSTPSCTVLGTIRPVPVTRWVGMRFCSISTTRMREVTNSIPAERKQGSIDDVTQDDGVMNNTVRVQAMISTRSNTMLRGQVSYSSSWAHHCLAHHCTPHHDRAVALPCRHTHLRSSTLRCDLRCSFQQTFDQAKTPSKRAGYSNSTLDARAGATRCAREEEAAGRRKDARTRAGRACAGCAGVWGVFAR